MAGPPLNTVAASPTVREGIVAASEPSLTVGLAATRLRRAMVYDKRKMENGK